MVPAVLLMTLLLETYDHDLASISVQSLTNIDILITSIALTRLFKHGRGGSLMGTIG